MWHCGSKFQETLVNIELFRTCFMFFLIFSLECSCNSPHCRLGSLSRGRPQPFNVLERIALSSPPLALFLPLLWGGADFVIQTLFTRVLRTLRRQPCCLPRCATAAFMLNIFAFTTIQTGRRLIWLTGTSSLHLDWFVWRGEIH